MKNSVKLCFNDTYHFVSPYAHVTMVTASNAIIYNVFLYRSVFYNH